MSSFDQSPSGSSLWVGGLTGRVRRRWAIEVLQILAVTADAALSFGSAIGAWLLYQGTVTITPFQSELALKVATVSTVLFVAFMAVRGAYRIAHLSDARRQLGLVVQGWAFTFIAMAWVAFLFKVSDVFSRGAVSLHFVIGGVVLLAAHGLGARHLARRYAFGRLSHSRVAVVAVADDSGLERIIDRLGHKGIEVAAATSISPTRIGRNGQSGAYRSVAGDVRAALATTRLDGIYLFVSWSDRRHIEELKAALSPMPVPIYLFADHEVGRLLERPQVRMGDLVGFELQRAPLSRFDQAMKRMLDITVASVGLVLLAPLMAMTALAVMVESGRPVLFRQHRKGFGARPFAILKFRSMKVMENGSTVTQASKDDARVTRIGRMIRRTSIDELPQLLNVLRGDMSIVGPRPHALAHDDLYDGLIASYAFRQHVKPGITGWAQVNGCRGETREVGQMRARVEHDLWYISNWSIWLDIRIIFLTAAQIFLDDQAY